MNIHREDAKYCYVGTENRYTKISKSLLANLNAPTILPAPDCTWKHDNYDYIMLSYGNSKVRELGLKLSTKAVAYGKSTILSCPFAANCVKFCYQNLNNYTASARMHGHNYYLVYSAKVELLITLIQMAIDNLKKGTTIVRLNDNGDFISKAEILAWVTIAQNNPSMVFYGYTKNTPHMYKARVEFGQFPSNFRVSISDLNENDATMEKYMRLLLSEFENEFRVCHIIDSVARDEKYSSLPWNDGETQAYNYTNDFKIALHLGNTQVKDCSDDEVAIDAKYKSGYTDDGIQYC